MTSDIRKSSLGLGLHPDRRLSTSSRVNYSRRLSTISGARALLSDHGNDHRHSLGSNFSPPSGMRTGRRPTAYANFMSYFDYDIPEETKEHHSDSDTSGSMEHDGHGTKYYGEANGMKFQSDFHCVVHKYTESRFFSAFIMFIILINTTMLVAQTWQVVLVRATWYFSAIDNVFLGIYVMEVVLKLYVWGSLFFKEGWNILDFTIVAFNIVDFSLPLVLSNVGGFNGAAIFRLLKIFRAVKAIRALRVLRTIRFLTNLQVILTTLLQSIRSIGAIVLLITLTMYMFAVIGKGLYAEMDEEHFGTLFNAIFTLFQLLTLDDWFEIYKRAKSKGSPEIILYLMLYIVVEYFIFLNLFVAVLVDNFQLSLEAANEAAKEKKLSKEQESDDEEMYGLDIPDGESVDTVVTESTKKRKTMEHHYSGFDEDDIELLKHYFHILTSMEHNYLLLGKQERVLNMMVDICADTNEGM